MVSAMNALLILSTYGAFIFAILGLFRPTEALVRRIYAWVPVPALVIGVISILRPDMEVRSLPNLLLGASVGLDELGRAFLILSAGVWLIAGLYSRNYFANGVQERLFRFSFLVTYSGTTGLAIAQDAASFYTGYALMTIGGYGLVVNVRNQAALLAGRVYFIVAFFGELLTLAGIIIAASTASGFSFTEIIESIRTSKAGAWSFWLIFVGFGTKVGLVPIHFWLPRSYFWAPLPAVAVLSGAMTKAGVLGWLRFLSGYESNLASAVIVFAGALMAFYGVFFGVLQTRAKTTLAFSSLSQMGYLTIGLATIVEAGAVFDRAMAAITAFAFHHGVTKVALFLGLGLLAKTRPRSKSYWFMLAALGICALSLIGVPLSGGAYAKALLKEAGTAEGVWSSVSGAVMTAGSIGTALIMLRFITLCARRERDQVQPTGAWVSWGLSFLIVFLGAWLFPYALTTLGFSGRTTLSFAESFMAFIPVAIGVFVVGAATFKIWTRQAHLSPRPFDTILQRVYKAVWEDFPRAFNEFIDLASQFLSWFYLSLQPERKAKELASFARSLQTSWFIGCTFFLVIGLVIWSCLAGGRS